MGGRRALCHPDRAVATTALSGSVRWTTLRRGARTWDVPDPSPEDAELVDVGARLTEGVTRALPGWVRACVARVAGAYFGDVPEGVPDDAAVAGERAAVEVGAELAALLAGDVDAQWTNPLTVVRGAARFPTEVLRRAGVPPVVRDEFDERHFPYDDYDLVPRSFADLDPSLHELGIEWGARKAKAHLDRRRAVEGG